MCGIIGIIGPNAWNETMERLQRLVYRGYDSWGIGTLENGVQVYKSIGNIRSAPVFRKQACTAIGHTRWATHGKVTKENAHPHVSKDGKFIVVHNGIIENAGELKTDLQEEGVKFLSETDSEIIPNLLQKYYFGDVFDAVKKTMELISGRSTVVFLTSHRPGIYFARKGLPLHLAKKGAKYFIGSDLMAFPEDAQCFTIPEGSYGCFGRNTLLKDLRRQISLPIHLTSRKSHNSRYSQISKENYSSFMEKEMHEAPTVLQETLKQDSSAVSEFCARFKQAKRVFCIGSGTSYHAALYAFHQWSAAHNHVAVHQGSEPFPYILLENDLIVVFSQSGETADILDIAEQHPEKCVAIVNKEESTLAQMSSLVFPLNVGPEQCVLATKSFLAQIIVIETLARGLGVNTQSAIPSKSDYCSIVNEVSNVLHVFDDRVFVLGRGESLPIAMECALKLKEGAYLHAEAVASGELKHGPLALIELGFPVIVFPSGESERIINAAEEIKARGGTIIGIDSVKEQCYDFHICVPSNDALSQTLAAFLLTYEISKRKGINIDYPRNLAKSVTVN